MPFVLWLLPLLALATALWWWAWPQQMQRACWTGEWPFEEGCPGTPRGSDPANPSQVLTEHLQRNVGDSRALAWLTRALWKEEDPRLAELLPHALALAPQEPAVLAIEAEARLKAQDWPAAVPVLITLLERGQAQVRPALVALMAAPGTQDLVLARVTRQAQWLDPLLAQLPATANAAALQPFITTGAELGLLKPATVLALVDRLKRDRAWIEAYALWVAWRGEVGAGLYNGGFERPSLRRGFDWEWTTQPAARQGYRVERVSASPRPGWMLELQLTGRAALPQPLLAQTLLLPAPRYRLRGQVMTDRLSTRDGLVWALRCADGGERWAQTAPLRDTQKQWQPFELEFEPPPECGAAVRLQLETAAAWEARAGMAGTVFFSGLSVDEAAAPAATEGQP